MGSGPGRRQKGSGLGSRHRNKGRLVIDKGCQRDSLLGGYEQNRLTL